MATIDFGHVVANIGDRQFILGQKTVPQQSQFQGANRRKMVGEVPCGTVVIRRAPCDKDGGSNPGGAKIYWSPGYGVGTSVLRLNSAVCEMATSEQRLWIDLFELEQFHYKMPIRCSISVDLRWFKGP